MLKEHPSEIILKGDSITKQNWETYKKGLIQYVDDEGYQALTPYTVTLQETIIDALAYSDMINPIGLYAQSIETPEDFVVMLDIGVLEWSLYETLFYAGEEELNKYKEFYDVVKLFRKNFEENHDNSWISECYKGGK